MALLVFSTSALANLGDDVDVLQDARSRSNDAIAAHDVDGILAELDSSFHVTARGGRFITSRAAIGEAFKSQFSQYPDAVNVRTPMSVKVSESGEREFEGGQWVGAWATQTGPFRSGGSCYK